MTKVYKYCDETGHGKIIDGQIRLRRLSYYRNCEQDPTIQDSQDGLATERFTGTIVGQKTIGATGLPPNYSFARVDKNATLHLDDVRMTASINPFIFCASLSSPENAQPSEMSEGYTHALVIQNFKKFREKILSELCKQDESATFEILEVQYQDPLGMVGTTLDGPYPNQKRLRFKDEREIRAVFDATDKIGEEVNVKIDPGDLIKDIAHQNH